MRTQDKVVNIQRFKGVLPNTTFKLQALRIPVVAPHHTFRDSSFVEDLANLSEAPSIVNRATTPRDTIPCPLSDRLAGPLGSLCDDWRGCES